MTKQDFIDLIDESDYPYEGWLDGHIHSLLLDHRAWEIVGSRMGWDDEEKLYCNNFKKMPIWQIHYLEYIHNLMDTGDIDSFLENL